MMAPERHGAGDGIVHIVDDDDAVRDATQLLLETCGFAVQSHASALTFLQAFHEANAGCILLDLHMPEMDGVELVELLHAHGVQTPVVVMSGRRDAMLDAELGRIGVAAILSKPCDEEVLLRTVRAALRPAMR
jgi:two-component system response regulator FixJ